MGIKVLHIHSEVKPGGGPHGYLYNLRKAIELNQGTSDVDIEILEIPPPSTPSAVSPAKSPTLVQRVVRRIKAKIEDKRESAGRYATQILDNYKTRFDWIEKSHAEKWFNHDVLVVHDPFLARKLVALCPERSKAKLVVITHSPTWFVWQTLGNDFPDMNQEWLYEGKVAKNLVQKELDTLMGVRAVGLPCKEAMQGYPLWHAKLLKGEANAVFVETGVPLPIANSTPQSMKESWGISSDQKIALFIGRPHPHKAFDQFVEWADYFKSQGRTDWVFVQAGSPSNSKRDLSSVNAVGWITDNASAYLAADLVLIPNTYSYFDIGTLEGIALGARIAISPTGGHGYLTRKFKEIPEIPSGKPEVTWPVLESTALEYASDDAKSRRLQDIWKNNFTPAHFYHNHVSMIKEILDERNHK